MTLTSLRCEKSKSSVRHIPGLAQSHGASISEALGSYSRVPPQAGGIRHAARGSCQMASVSGENAMKSKSRSLILAISMTSLGMLSMAPAAAGGQGALAPLTIQEQGSFAVGGTVIKSPGTFDPIKQTPEGQTLHG